MELFQCNVATRCPLSSCGCGTLLRAHTFQSSRRVQDAARQVLDHLSLNRCVIDDVGDVVTLLSEEGVAPLQEVTRHALIVPLLDEAIHLALGVAKLFRCHLFRRGACSAASPRWHLWLEHQQQ